MSTISAGTTSGTALVSTGNTDGTLVLQTNGTTTAVTIGTNQVVTLAQPLPVGSGGTGATTLTSNNVILGNGTSAVQFVAPGTSGNLLTSNGTTWASTAPAASGSWVYIASATASNSASLTFTNISSTYNMYAVVLTKLLPATDDVDLYLRTSTDNGSSYDAGASDYINLYWSYSGGGTPTAFNNTGISYIRVAGVSANNGVGNASGEGGVNSTIYLANPSGSTSYFNVFGDTYFLAANGTQNRAIWGGSRLANADVDAIQFLFSSGNVTSGTARLYGIKNS